jgi:hypothetical protein
MLTGRAIKPRASAPFSFWRGAYAAGARAAATATLRLPFCLADARERSPKQAVIGRHKTNLCEIRVESREYDGPTKGDRAGSGRRCDPAVVRGEHGGGQSGSGNQQLTEDHLMIDMIMLLRTLVFLAVLTIFNGAAVRFAHSAVPIMFQHIASSTNRPCRRIPLS